MFTCEANAHSASQPQNPLTRRLRVIALSCLVPILIVGCRDPLKPKWDAFSAAIKAGNAKNAVSILQEIKAENPAAVFEGVSVNALIDDWQVTADMQNNLENLKKSSQDYRDRLREIDRGY